MPFSVEKLDEFARWLAGLLPDSAEEARGEIEKKLRAGLEPMLEKMNLVSREEYDVQVALLERLRQKLGALERRMTELERTKSADKPEQNAGG